MEGREELVMLLHFGDDAGKQQERVRKALSCLCPRHQTRDAEPVDVIVSQQLVNSGGVFSGGNQSDHLVHHLSRRNSAI